MNGRRNFILAAFTRFELLVTVAVVVVLLLAVLPTLMKPEMRVKALNCVNLQKQIGLSFRLWSGDHRDKMPPQVSTNNGGTKELLLSGLGYPHFLVMSNELGSPWNLRCFSDAQRTPATNFAGLRNSNISYFVVPEADETVPDLWLSGDRNLATNNGALSSGLFTMPTNLEMSWTSQLHINKGNICFADGSVQQFGSAGTLQRSVTNAVRAYRDSTADVTTLRLIFP